MNFDIYAFGEMGLYIIPLVIIASISFSAILVAIAQRSSLGMQIMVILGYLFCFGVITHELAHRTFCWLFGVQVRETQFFKVTHHQGPEGKSVSIGGYIDCEEIGSVTVALFIGFAPLLVNGLLVTLLYYYGPSFQGTWFFPLSVFLGISLGLGTPTSKEDASLWIHTLKHNPGRGLLELIGLCCFGGLMFYLTTSFQIPLWGTTTILVCFFLGTILLGRFRTGGSNHVPRI